jgi:uncharacterized protein involved in exopolysaccharide biosynthesis
MMERVVEQNTAGYEGEINLRELFLVFWQGRYKILMITLIGAMISIGYALWLPNIYTSEAVVAPRAEGSGLNGLAGQLGGLAGLAGIEIGGGEGSKTLIALETMKSRAFFEKYVYEEALVALMAATGWASGALILDEDVYDRATANWTREIKAPYQAKPSVQEAYQKFSREHFSVLEDKKTGFVTIRVRHYSPLVAHQWLEIVLRSIELSVREREVQEAERAIVFLKSEISKTALISLNEVFAGLVEEQTKKIVLANASKEYVFQVIEPSVVAEAKSEPKRAQICILGTLIAVVIALLIVLAQHLGLNNPSGVEKR